MASLDQSPIAAEAARSTIPLNLGIIIPELEKYGGAERYLIECVKVWQSRHNVTIYSAVFNHDMLRESMIHDTVKLVEIARSFAGEHAFFLNAVLLPKLWRQQIGRHDVYHSHLWPTHMIDLHPMVWFPHEPLRLLHDLRFEQRQSDPENHEVHIYPKYNYDHISDNIYDAYRSAIDAMDHATRPDYIVANSSYMAGYLARVYGGDVAGVVYPGVDTDSFIDLKVDRKLFVTISQLWPHKRVNLLIEAIALTDETQLIVIGSGPELDRLQSLCIKLGVEDRVFFLAGLKNFEVSLVLARACALLFCPIREPFGIVVLEAMAAGKPIVAVNEGGYVEVCHPDFAILIPPSPLLFAEKIEYLRDNPEQGRAMGNAAREAAKKFAWKRSAAELEAFLLAASSKGKPCTALASERRESPLLGIQYYLWYGDGFGMEHWNDSVKFGHVGDHPFLGYYASERGQTIEYHLDQFEAMKLDFVLLNLHIDPSGANETEWRSIRNLFDISSERGSTLRFAIQISPYGGDAEQIRDVIAVIRETFLEREQYLRIDGKPVLFWFWSSAFDGSRILFDAMSEVAAEFRNFAVSLRLPKGIEESRYTFDFFEGFGLYSPLEVSSEANWERTWQGAVDAAQTAGMHYQLISVSPGYDDSALQDPQRAGNPYRMVPRREGETYGRTLKFAKSLAKPPDIVVVSTYNEFHENTHVESSARYGNKYVELTREFVERMHAMKLDRNEEHG
jgi:glycosyltransferase involved in cell wall biosynthesis